MFYDSVLSARDILFQIVVAIQQGQPLQKLTDEQFTKLLVYLKPPANKLCLFITGFPGDERGGWHDQLAIATKEDELMDILINSVESMEDHVDLENIKAHIVDLNMEVPKIILTCEYKEDKFVWEEHNDVIFFGPDDVEFESVIKTEGTPYEYKEDYDEDWR